jgi:hypothetical protein
MDMPQKQAYENLAKKEGKGMSHSCYRGSSKFDSLQRGTS